MALLRMRRLQIRVTTETGVFGTDIAFPNGLVVLQADNTSGKSTCLMSLLYGLGLEGMLGPIQQPPLPPAMLEEISTDNGLQRVIDSFVRVEVEGAGGRVATVRRQVTGSSLSRQRISVIEAAALSNPSTPLPEGRDYFVRTKGAAQSELGFHSFLARFIGLELPVVSKFDGEATPLYLECLFPFFFVDQLSGWRDIKARMPTYLQIPEMSKRAAEFILALDILLLSVQRERLSEQVELLKRRWANIVSDTKARMPRIGLVVQGMPDAPPDSWPSDVAPTVLVSRDDKWVPLDAYRADLSGRLSQLVLEEIPRVKEVSQGATARLREYTEELDTVERRFEELSREAATSEEQVRGIDERLAALREDYRQYEDEKRLRDRGGQGRLKTATGVCPACGQSIKDVLLPQTSPLNPMSLEENMAFLRDQITTFREMREDAVRVLEAKRQVGVATQSRIDELRSLLRAQKETLRSEGEMPSVAAIQERLQLESRLSAVELAEVAFREGTAKLSVAYTEWQEVQRQLKDLGAAGLSDSDRQKLATLQESFLAQLREYKFTSYPIDRIGIDPQSYRPSHEGFDLGITSASDAIRVVWAYLLAMMEVSRGHATNHLGMLVLDEPKQQMVAEVSFEALMRRAAASGSANQQVIFATSQKLPEIEAMLKNLPNTLIPLTKWILKRIDTGS